eukprot:gene8710-6126_t
MPTYASDESASGRRKIILDCDPGHDDAIAMLLAFGNPKIDLLAVTTVVGNQTLPKVTRNARAVAQVAHMIDVPIAAGCPRPLVREVENAASIHGESGLEGPQLPEPTNIPLDPRHAVDLIIETVMQHEPRTVTLVPTGGLTNIALAARKEPRIVSRVKEVVLMGGGYHTGNWSAVAEFNIKIDPEAAHIVFNEKWPVTMVGLDLTHQALATPNVVQAIQQLNTKPAAFVVELLNFFGTMYKKEQGFDYPPVHDPCAVAYVIDPTVMTTQRVPVNIELNGTLTMGMTVADFRSPPGPDCHTQVAVKLDTDKFWGLRPSHQVRHHVTAREFYKINKMHCVAYDPSLPPHALMCSFYMFNCSDETLLGKKNLFYLFIFTFVLQLKLFRRINNFSLPCSIHIGINHNLNEYRVLFHKNCCMIAGCPSPLVREVENAASIHGESGLEGPQLPEPTNIPLDPRNAVDLIIEIVNAFWFSCGFVVVEMGQNNTAPFVMSESFIIIIVVFGCCCSSILCVVLPLFCPNSLRVNFVLLFIFGVVDDVQEVLIDLFFFLSQAVRAFCIIYVECILLQIGFRSSPGNYYQLAHKMAEQQPDGGTGVPRHNMEPPASDLSNTSSSDSAVAATAAVVSIWMECRGWKLSQEEDEDGTALSASISWLSGPELPPHRTSRLGKSAAKFSSLVAAGADVCAVLPLGKDLSTGSPSPASFFEDAFMWRNDPPWWPLRAAVAEASLELSIPLLMDVILFGDMEVVRACLSSPRVIDFSVVDANGNTPLHAAVLADAGVRACLAAGADLMASIADSSHPDPQTLLTAFIESRRWRVAAACMSEPLVDWVRRSPGEWGDFTGLGGARSASALYPFQAILTTDTGSPAYNRGLVRLLVSATLSANSTNFWSDHDFGDKFLSLAAEQQLLSVVWPEVSERVPYFRDRPDPIRLSSEVWRWDWEALGREAQRHFDVSVAVMQEMDQLSGRLWKACEGRGDPEMLLHSIDLSVAAGADVMLAIPGNRQPLLIHLLHCGATGLASLLLQSPSMLDWSYENDENGSTVLHLSTVGQRKGEAVLKKVLYLLLDRLGIGLPSSTCNTASQYIEKERQTVPWGQRNDFGASPLCDAAAYGQLAIWVSVVLLERPVEYYVVRRGRLRITSPVSLEDWEKIDENDRRFFRLIGEYCTYYLPSSSLPYRSSRVKDLSQAVPSYYSFIEWELVHVAMPLADADLDAAIECGIHAAHVACTVINAALDDQRAGQDRSSPSPLFVSHVEKHCEDEIMLYLRAATPSYSILTRKDGRSSFSHGPTWFIDPVAGVSSFAHGMPNVSVSIALMVDKEVVLGIVNAPRIGEHYIAVKGRGAFCNGQRIHVSATLGIQQSLVLRSQTCNRTERGVRCMIAVDQELNMIPVHSVLCNGSVALDMCFVAAGKADIYFEAGIGVWSFAAGVIIVKEAGGIVHDVEDTEKLRWERQGICCGNNVMLTSQIVQLLKKHHALSVRASFNSSESFLCVFVFLRPLGRKGSLGLTCFAILVGKGESFLFTIDCSRCSMYFLSEVDFFHDRDEFLSTDCQNGVVAALYASGELVVKDTDDDHYRFSTWVKNPHKVFLHPLGSYVIVTSTDGLLHFFSAAEASLRCITELRSSELHHRTLIGECVCWLTKPDDGNSTGIAIVVGTLSWGILFEIDFQFLSRSIKPTCSLLCRPVGEKNSYPICSVFYAGNSNRHTLIVSTPVKLLFITAPKSECKSVLSFLDGVRSEAWPFETVAEVRVAPPKGTSCGFFTVFLSAESSPRSFCWTHSEGVIHGLFQWSGDGTETRFFQKLEHIRSSASSDLWASEAGGLVCVVPTSSHMVFHLQSSCFAVQHPAGVAWNMSTEAKSTVEDFHSSRIFESSSDSLLAEAAPRAVVYDQVQKRCFIQCVNRMLELSLKEDVHSLWELFIQRGANHLEIDTLRERYLKAALKVATTPEEKNTACYLLGFCLLTKDREAEGVATLAECDWFDDIFSKLKANAGLCDRYIEKRVACELNAYKKDAASARVPQLLRIVYFCLWWKATNSSISKVSVESFIDLVFQEVPLIVSEDAFVEDVVELLTKYGHADCCTALYLKLKRFDSVLSFFIQQNNLDRAVETLIDCDPKESQFRKLWYMFLPQIIHHAPVKLLSTLRRVWVKAHRVGTTIDLEPFLPAFLKYKVEDNEVPNQVHQVKALLNSVIYRYGVDSRVLHNYYLYLLAEEGDEERLTLHLENSAKYDTWFAMYCCLKLQETGPLITLYKRLGFYGDVLKILISRDPVDRCAVREASSYVNAVQRKAIWKKALEEKFRSAGARGAEQLVELSEGILNVEDLLRCVKEDSAAVEQLKDTICQQLDQYSVSCVNHAALYSTALEAVAISKYQLQEVQQEVSYISSTQKCVLCGKLLLSSSYEPYLVYPTCRHAVHESCAVQKVQIIGCDAFKDSLKDIKEWSLEEIAASDCVICGEAAILEIEIPLVEIGKDNNCTRLLHRDVGLVALVFLQAPARGRRRGKSARGALRCHTKMPITLHGQGPKPPKNEARRPPPAKRRIRHNPAVFLFFCFFKGGKPSRGMSRWPPAPPPPGKPLGASLKRIQKRKKTAHPARHNPKPRSSAKRAPANTPPLHPRARKGGKEQRCLKLIFLHLHVHFQMFLLS